MEINIKQEKDLLNEIHKLYGDNYFIIDLNKKKYYTLKSFGKFEKEKLHCIIPQQIKKKKIVIILDIVNKKLDIVSVHQPVQTKLFLPPIIM